MGDSALAYACAQCGSDRITPLSLVYEDGFSRTKSGTVGVGLARGGSIGVGGAATKGVQQTETSRRYAPPTPPRMPSLFLLGVLEYFLIMPFILVLSASISPWTLLLTIPSAVAGFVWFNRRMRATNRRSMETYQTARAAWERSYLCERCGKVTERS